MMPLSKTLDHTGPMCRSAMDCAIFLDAMKGFDPLDPCALPAPNPAESIAEMLRSSEGSAPVDAVLVVVPSMVAGCTPEVLAHFEASLEVLKSLGCTVVEAEPLAGFVSRSSLSFLSFLPPCFRPEAWSHPLSLRFFVGPVKHNATNYYARVQDPEAMAKAKQISQIEKAAYIEEILRERPTEVSPMCQRQSLAALEVPATVYVGAATFYTPFDTENRMFTSSSTMLARAKTFLQGLWRRGGRLRCGLRRRWRHMEDRQPSMQLRPSNRCVSPLAGI